MAKKPTASLLEASPALVPDTPVPTVQRVDPAIAEHKRLADALTPYEPNPDVRAFVAEQLQAAKAWGAEVSIKLPASMVTAMLEAATRVAAE